MKISNLDEILDEIGDFGRTKNDILDNVFLLSLAIYCPVFSSYCTTAESYCTML